MNQPTIIALATPVGKSGVAVLRISGPEAKAALSLLDCPCPAPRMASLLALKDKSGNVIDKALVLYFQAPHSFTGEDVVELHTHGSRAVIKKIMETLALPLAERGEFTRRALMNGKLDLLEVEALADLIDAETEAQRVQALKQYSGESTQKFEALREGIIYALAMVEAYIDFPDEDIPTHVTDAARTRVESVLGDINSLLHDNGAGERIRDGFNVIIMGAPNVGKSTLLNALAKRDIAIVSSIAGTTRDVIEAQLDIGGYPVTLIDTAGLRESSDEIEAIGIAKARKRAENADIILWLLQPDGAPPAMNEMQAPVLFIANKQDEGAAMSKAAHSLRALPISAKTGAGLDALIVRLQEMLGTLHKSGDGVLITRARHRNNLEAAKEHLYQSLKGLPLELVCEELRLAAREIGKITGKIDVDSVLDVVFSSFCIGK